MNNTQQEVPRLRTDVPQLNHLCETCSSRFPSDSPWPSFFEFLRTEDLDGVSLGENSLLQLHESAGRGCHLCTLLLEAILPERMTIGLEQDEDLMAKTSFQLRMLPDSGGWVLQMRHLPSGNVKDCSSNPSLRRLACKQTVGSGLWSHQLGPRCVLLLSRANRIQTSIL
jgi:hypothetical protein